MLFLKNLLVIFLLASNNFLFVYSKVSVPQIKRLEQKMIEKIPNVYSDDIENVRLFIKHTLTAEKYDRTASVALEIGIAKPTLENFLQSKTKNLRQRTIDLLLQWYGKHSKESEQIQVTEITTEEDVKSVIASKINEQTQSNNNNPSDHVSKLFNFTLGDKKKAAKKILVEHLQQRARNGESLRLSRHDFKVIIPSEDFKNPPHYWTMKTRSISFPEHDVVSEHDWKSWQQSSLVKDAWELARVAAIRSGRVRSNSGHAPSLNLMDDNVIYFLICRVELSDEYGSSNNRYAFYGYIGLSSVGVWERWGKHLSDAERMNSDQVEKNSDKKVKCQFVDAVIAYSGYKNCMLFIIDKVDLQNNIGEEVSTSSNSPLASLESFYINQRFNASTSPQFLNVKR